MKKSLVHAIFSSDKTWFLFSVFLSVACLLIIFSGIYDHSMSGKYFNSDMLYNQVIFKDVFIDKSGFKGWHLNAAPNFFPDMFAYFILYAVSGDFVIANFLFSITQYLAIIFLISYLFHQTGNKRAWLYSSVFNYLMFLFLLIPVFTGRSHLTFQVISISYHLGSFIMFLLSINLLILYTRTNKLIAVILLFFTVTLGVFNDRLYISQFILPLIPIGILLFNKVNRRKLLLPLVIIVLATFSGWFLFKKIQSGGTIYIIDTGFKMFNFENLSNSWRNFWNFIEIQITHYNPERIIILIGLLSFSMSALYLLIHSKRLLFPDTDEKDFHARYVILFITIYIPVTLLTPVINGAFVSPSIIRFNVMAFFMGIMLLPFLLMVWPTFERNITRALKYILPITTLAFVVFFCTKIFTADFKKGLHEYFNYYPEVSAIIDDLKKEHDLKYGVGNYWYAKYATMFSKNDVRLYTVFDHSLRPWYHSTNENWYHKGGKGKYKDPVFNFNLREINSDSEKLKEVFGEKLDTIYRDKGNKYVVIKLPEFEIDRETREIKLLGPAD